MTCTSLYNNTAEGASSIHQADARCPEHGGKRMSKVNNGGPAFPLLGEGPNAPCFNEGMTLRDWFAGQALAGLVASSVKAGEGAIKLLPKACVEFADALIAELAKEKNRG